MSARISGSSSTTKISATTPLSAVRPARLSRSDGSAGDGRNDRHGLPIGDFRIEAVEEANVLVGDEHIDEAPQLAGVVEQPLAETGMSLLERFQHFGQRVPLDGHLRRPA